MNISKLPINVAYCSERILREVYSKVSDLTCLSFLHQKEERFVVKRTEDNAFLCGDVGLSSKSHIKRQDFWTTKILLRKSTWDHLHISWTISRLGESLQTEQFLLTAALQTSFAINQEFLFSCQHQWKLISYDVNHQ